MPHSEFTSVCLIPLGSGDLEGGSYEENSPGN